MKSQELTRLVLPDTSPTALPLSQRNTLANDCLPSPQHTIRWPSSDHAMSTTAPDSGWCSALRVMSSLRPHTRTLPDASPDATHWPFGDIRATVTGY